jgi:hypothetical protein
MINNDAKGVLLHNTRIFPYSHRRFGKLLKLLLNYSLQKQKATCSLFLILFSTFAAIKKTLRHEENRIIRYHAVPHHDR